MCGIDFLFLLYLLFMVHYATTTEIKNSTKLSALTVTSYKLVTEPLRQRCHGMECPSPPERIYCPKNKSECNQKCSGPHCYTVCDQTKVKCKQKCSSNSSCTQLCLTKECSMNCRNTKTCIQMAGTRKKWARHHLRCVTKSIEGCVQECNGNCTVECNTTGICKQVVKMARKYVEVKVAVGLAKCKSENACYQHCVSQLCIFHCDAPFCHITTRDNAMIGFKMSTRVNNITLHCNKKRVPWKQWNNTLGYRLCDWKDVLKVAYMPDVRNNSTKTQRLELYPIFRQVPSRIRYLGKNIPEWMLDEARNLTQEPFFVSDSLLRSLRSHEESFKPILSRLAMSSASQFARWNSFHWIIIAFLKWLF